jgi:TonB family protein
MRSVVPFLAVVLLGLHAVPGLSAQQPGTPAKITHVDPVYPEQARQARVQGIVMVQITIGADGRVSNARVIRSIPMLDEAAVNAVRQWVYDAATIKAPVTLTVTVPFAITAPPETSAPRLTRPAAASHGTQPATTASEPTDPVAMNNLGAEYQSRQDYENALRWYRRAAELGNALAMRNIGDMYYAGKGVPTSSVQSLDWWLKGARAGNAQAMLNVSIAYDPDLSSPVNKRSVEAFSWALKAAELGHGSAMRWVSLRYQSGRGTDKNGAEATRWYLKSGEAKDARGNEGDRGRSAKQP